MSELIAEASKALSSWPAVNAFFLVAITFLTVMAMRKGDRDRKAVVEGVDMPTYLMNYDALKAVQVIKNQVERSTEAATKTNAILEDIAKQMADFNHGQKHTHRLLEDIANNQEMRHTMAHPTGHRGDV